MKKKLISLLIFLMVMMTMASCAKRKRNWKVVGEEDNKTPIEFGVHPERGTDSNAAKVYVATIYYPLGRDENGKSTYRKILYDMEELTPNGLDLAMKDLGILSLDTLFVDFEIEDSDVTEAVGPGAVGEVLNKMGTIYYVNDMDGHEIYSALYNFLEYEGKTNLEGMIDEDDIINAMCYTFKDNYQLVSCGLVPANYQDYLNSKSKK